MQTIQNEYDKAVISMQHNRTMYKLFGFPVHRKMGRLDIEQMRICRRLLGRFV